MMTLKVDFTNVRKAEDVVKDLKFAFDWDQAELVIDSGFPKVRYHFTNEDGEGEQRVRTLLDLDALCQECSDGTNPDDTSFNERFDYVFHLWGRDENGNWFIGYVC